MAGEQEEDGPPAFVLVMRHAEKPADPYDPGLTPAGRARAQALASYIPATFGGPDFIFATAPSKHSTRPIDTVRPLSELVGATIDATLADQEYGVLADMLTHGPGRNGKRGVVCWHHGNIPSILRALGAPGGSYPDPWNPSVFNLILRVGFEGGIVKVTEATEPF